MKKHPNYFKKIKEFGKSLGGKWVGRATLSDLKEFNLSQESIDVVNQKLGAVNIGVNYFPIGKGHSRITFYDLINDCVVKVEYQVGRKCNNRNEAHNWNLLGQHYRSYFAPVLEYNKETNVLYMQAGRPFVDARDGIIVNALECMTYLRNNNYAWFKLEDVEDVEQLRCIDYESMGVKGEILTVPFLSLSLNDNITFDMMWSAGDCRRISTGEPCTPKGKKARMSVTKEDLDELDLILEEMDLPDKTRINYEYAIKALKARRTSMSKIYPSTYQLFVKDAVSI